MQERPNSAVVTAEFTEINTDFKLHYNYKNRINFSVLYQSWRYIVPESSCE